MTGADFPGLGEHTWLSENGIELKTRELRPVVDELTGRLYAFTPQGDVVLLKEYEHYRKGRARDAAITFWGDPRAWEDIADRVVRCTCVECETPVCDLSSAWQITQQAEGTLKARVVSVSDIGTEVIGDEHTIYTSPFLLMDAADFHDDDAAAFTHLMHSFRSIEVDTFSAMVERFGEPYDMATGEINPSYALVYDRSG